MTDAEMEAEMERVVGGLIVPSIALMIVGLLIMVGCHLMFVVGPRLDREARELAALRAALERQERDRIQDS